MLKNAGDVRESEGEREKEKKLESERERENAVNDRPDRCCV